MKNTSVGWRLGRGRPPFAPPPSDELHPSVHPSVRHPSIDSDDQDWNHRSGLLEEAMVLRRAVVLCRRCSGWRRSRGPDVWPPTSPLNRSPLGASGARHLFLFSHTHVHTRATGTNPDAGTDVAARASWIHTNTHAHTQLDVLPRCGETLKTGLFVDTQSPHFPRGSSSSNSSADDIKRTSDPFFLH